MNREEAIYFANSLKNNYTVDLNDMEAFCDMAIKALAQEPATKNDSSELEKNSKKLEKGTTKNNLGVEEVTALAEWTEKLTKASEDAYNKGYADGMKAQEPRKGYWLCRPHVYGVTYCSVCDFELKIDDTNYCPNCGAKMAESEAE